MIQQNVGASENLFKIVTKKSNNLQKFIFFSSLAAMGFQRGLSVGNDTKPEPDTIYGESKYIAEQKLEQLASENDTPLVIIRPSLVYGPGDRTSDFLNSCRLINKGFFPIFGTGKNIMSPVIFIDDLIEICHRFSVTKSVGKYICCNDEKFTIMDFVKIIASNFNKKNGSLKIPVVLGQILITPIELLCKVLNKPAPLNRRRVMDLSVDRKLHSIHSALKDAIDYEPETNLQMG